jgi:hypothetical protein
VIRSRTSTFSVVKLEILQPGQLYDARTLPRRHIVVGGRPTSARPSSRLLDQIFNVDRDQVRRLRGYIPAILTERKQRQAI